MSTHQLKDGRWICKFPAGTLKGDPKRTKEYFGRGPEGERKAKERNAELGIGVASKKATTPNFLTLYDEYIESRKGSIKKGTLASLQCRLPAVVLPILGHLQAHEIDHDALDSFVKSCRERRGLKNNSINAYLIYVFAVMNHAADRGRIISNPIKGYGKLRNDDERIRPPSKPEFEAILKHARPHLQRAMLIAYYTAMRVGPSELFGLRWQDIDFYSEIIMVTSADKGGMAKRDVPISEKLMAYLKEWKAADEAQGIKSAYIMQWGGKKITRMEASWESAKRKAGIYRRLRLYDLRHMSATAMLTAGADAKSVSQVLGHASVMQTLTTYQHIINAQRVDAVGKL